VAWIKLSWDLYTLTDHPITVSCNKAIKSFNNRHLLANDTPQQRTIYNFYRLNTPLKFPQTLAQSELLVNCSLNHSLDWTLTQFPQLRTLTYHFVLNLNTSTRCRVQDLQAGFLFTSTTAHHRTSATQPPDKLHASSPKSRAQHLANTAPNTAVKANDKHSTWTLQHTSFIFLSHPDP